MKYLLTLFFCLSLFSQENPLSDELNKASLILKKLEAWQQGGPASSKVLRVVYFYPKDRKPAANYQKRWDGILQDFENFFRKEMKRNGFGDRTIALEKENGRMKLHMVQGKSNDDGTYSYRSGSLIRKEVKEALAAKGIDMSQETVLIVNGLSKTKDNKIEIYSPFYGQGANQKYGICHAMDADFLSIEGLKSKGRKLMVKEHGGFRPFTEAKFNTTYIGGTIHELGHGLSLPHNHANSKEKHLGTALMGSGNYTYRKEWRNEGKGSFLTHGHAIRLLTHPLFSGSMKDRETKVEAEFTDLKFELLDKKIVISGKINSNVPACAVIAYNDEKGKAQFFQVNNDYDARIWTSAVDSGNRFKISIGDLIKGNLQIRLTAVHCNGATTTRKFHYKSASKHEPDLSRIKKELLIAETTKVLEPVLTAYSSDKSKAKAEAERLLPGSQPEIAKRLKHIISLCGKKVNGVKPSVVPVDTKIVYLSDCKWDSAKVGWRRPAANMYCLERKGDLRVLLEIDGNFYPKGLYAHSPSTYTFDLGGKWKEFSTSFGFRDGGSNSARFIIKGDGKTLFKSGTVTAGSAQSSKVDVSGVKKLELVIEGTTENNAKSWTIWVNPELKR